MSAATVIGKIKPPIASSSQKLSQLKRSNAFISFLDIEPIQDNNDLETRRIILKSRSRNGETPKWRYEPIPGVKVSRILFGRHHFEAEKVDLDPLPASATAAIQDPNFYSDDRRVTVKDNIATEQYPTTCASGILRAYRSPFEATAVKSLRRARAAIVSGKTNMDEFGMGSHSTNSFFGSVQNDEPFNQVSVGGSSGGSAVAVATGQCNTALGTDTGGSVRLPAAYTGTVGFKPSYGLISRWGVVPYANSLDTVGILARSTELALSMLDSDLIRHDPRDPTSLSPKSRKRMWKYRKSLANSVGRDNKYSLRKSVRFYKDKSFSRLKIGIPMEYNIAELDPAVREAWHSALNLFQAQGCTLVPIALPSTKHALSAYYVLAAAEAASNLSKYDGVRYGTRAESKDGAGDILYSNTRGEGLGDEVKRRILLGSYSLSSKAIDNYFIKAQKVRRLVQRDFDRVFSLPNLLRPPEQFDLSDMDDGVQLANKLGPQQVDFIVCPSAPTLPPSLDGISKQSPIDSYINDVFTVPSSLAGLPAVSIPFMIPREHTRPDTPPFAGIQLIGQYSDDQRLLLTASVVEMLHFEHPKLVTNTIDGDDTSSKDFVSDGARSMVRRVPIDSKSAHDDDPTSEADIKVKRHYSYPDPRIRMHFGRPIETNSENFVDDRPRYTNQHVPISKVEPYDSDSVRRIGKHFTRPMAARKVLDKLVWRSGVPLSGGKPEPSKITTHFSKKGDSLRKPRTEKEITKSVEDTFEDWDSLMSGKR